MQLMTRQTIISGNYVENKQFSRPIGYGFRVKRDEITRRKHGEKRHDNIARAKKKIFRLTMANEMRYRPIFLTLTYKENMCDRSRAQKDIARFFRLLRKEYPRVGYLYVLERQQRGAYHFHILLFNVAFIPLSILQRIWTYGYNDVVKTQDAQHCAFYLCKYLGEDFDQNFNTRAFSRSHGLLSPVMFRHVVMELYNKGNLLYEGGCSNVMNILVLTRAFYVRDRSKVFEC